MAGGGGWLSAMRVAPLLALAACSSQPDAPTGLTEDDQQQLNDAAEMLDTNGMAPRAVIPASNSIESSGS